MDAATTARHRFTGFPHEGLDLLRQLQADNTRAWFEIGRAHV